MTPGLSAETLAQVRALMKKVGEEDPQLLRSWTVPATPTEGLQGYDLSGPAQTIYPVLTPLRNRLPRNGGGYGSAVAWKAVTAINSNNMPVGVAEGKRGAVISTTVADRISKYVTIGYDDDVTFEADSAARNFDDPRARAIVGLLRSTMIAEERLFVGGNQSVALGTPTAPTVTNDTSGAGGTLANSTLHHVRVVALTLEGYTRSTVASPGGVPMTLTKTNADATTDQIGGGSSKISNASTTTTGAGGATNRILASTPVIPGAVAYAWFVGTDATTNCRLVAITTINSVIITGVPAAITPLAYANLTGWGVDADDFTTNNTDNSRNLLEFDGLFSIVTTSGSGAYFASLATGTAGVGTSLTNNGAGGVTEIDAALLDFWNTKKLSPSEILVSAQQMRDITKLVISSGGAPLYRLNIDQNVAKQVADVTAVAGVVVGSYLNPYALGSGQLIPIRIHPNMPPGTIAFWTDYLPYQVSDVPFLMEVKTRRDYYQIPYPLRTRKYEYGVYSEEVLRCFFPPAFGLITNIAPA